MGSFSSLFRKGANGSPIAKTGLDPNSFTSNFSPITIGKYWAGLGLRKFGLGQIR